MKSGRSEYYHNVLTTMFEIGHGTDYLCVFVNKFLAFIKVIRKAHKLWDKASDVLAGQMF